MAGKARSAGRTLVNAAIRRNISPAHHIEANQVGEAAAEIAAALAGLDFHDDETLEAAVAHATHLARPGEVVLLSPACASFDQFRSFEHRGEEFGRLVQKLNG